jgi:prepilin-type N-terminal cleavage/methylation domain-containing protein/prepilin-type processing-associated H-X9-DG protein
MGRRKGFTLIELLVVIAIIGILAAMLFPVFARARESARKIQCLANVKNIALAMQMYLTDYDRFPPKERRADIVQFYDDRGCNGAVQGTKNNPYLKWPVILDEYIKNREVWKCPSARYMRDLKILNPLGGDWWARAMELNASAGDCSPFMQCGSPFPPGWGGSVTDSYLQQTCGTGSTGGIELGLNGLNENFDLSTSAISDPARWLAVIEAGAGNDTWSTFLIAYPDMCKLGCATTKTDSGCSVQVDWANCSWTQNCGAGDARLGGNIELRKAWARHMGGVNLGYADGHAKWMNSEAVMSGSIDYRWWIPDSQKTPETAAAIIGPVGLCMMPEF